ncbi:DMT family transporter [Aeoliella sp. ICT_H6.2]|uniref:DMT family transporter n=1 Tax=Aeoliella straminimaris TaxID=2954799 RepID=A0A9X2F780_9BACT|nr:DMT family transporter [Aeoliella straminimaris]MCO6042923.1 DMT family transporter [Aeoliella straminimaris]
MFASHLGEFAGLAAALLWAVTAMLYFHIGRSIPPLTLNLYKGVLASTMLAVALAVQGSLFIAGDATALAWLLASGAVGIGIGDTAFFAALNRLGERRTVLMAETLAPPLTTLIAMVVLAELLPLAAYLGMALTLLGVAWVIVDRGIGDPRDREHLKSGVVYAMVAALCQAIGAVISRGILTTTDIGPMQSALVRMLGGVAILLVWLPASGRPLLPSSARRTTIWRWILLATFIGTFIGITLQQIALQNADAGIAQTLLATSSLFVMPLVVLRGESVSLRAVCGAVMAVGGIAMLFAAS